MNTSFIEQMRRKQVIEAAIAVLAQHGYGQTSFSRIAEQAGISKSIITYHFRGKDELFEQLFAHVLKEAGDFMAPSLEQAATVPDQIEAYIAGQLAYMKAHRNSLLAIGQLALGHLSNGQPPAYIAAAEAEEQALLTDLFKQGQCEGIFRQFDTAVMAQVLAKAIEAALTAWASQPETDLKAYGNELVTMFSLAMRSDQV